MTRIEHPYYLFALLLIAVLIFIYIFYHLWQKKMMKQFGEWKLVEQMIAGKSTMLTIFKFLLTVISFALIIFALANVQAGSAKKTVKHEGIDLAILLDISMSMLADDVKPDRLDAAKQFTSQLIDRLPDERIALITFAGTPVLQTPISIDHSATQLILNSVSENDIPEQGTDLGAAIMEAIKALPENQNHYRAIVLISDGEDLEGTVDEALEQAADGQIIICTAGIGTLKGTTIPITVDGNQTDKRDAQGNAVISKLHPDDLKNIASKSHGVYVQVNQQGSEAMNTLLTQLDGISKNQFDEEILTEYESQFQWLLIPALLLLVLDLFVGNRKVKWFKKMFQSRNVS